MDDLVGRRLHSTKKPPGVLVLLMRHEDPFGSGNSEHGWPTSPQRSSLFVVDDTRNGVAPERVTREVMSMLVSRNSKFVFDYYIPGVSYVFNYIRLCLRV